jgi:hypothetical protein
MSKVRQWAALGLALGFSACAPPALRDRPRPAEARAAVVVQNHLAETVQIYLVNADGAHWRMATVAGSSTVRVPVDEQVLTQRGGVQLVARPVGPGAALRLPCGSIAPGSRVELVLDRSPVFSNCWVR